ncbi:MAG: sialidase family protein [Planctomycetota bacterium]|nr:sialidase family protein [Planctomycetota bacterium]
MQGKKIITDPRCVLVDTDQFGPFVRLRDGNVLTVGDNSTQVSEDGGTTWSAPQKMYRGPGKEKPSNSGVLVRTRDGVIVYVYLDFSTYKWKWNEKKKEAAPDVRLDAWSIRSEDEGKSWTGRTKVFEGYCGALINVIETSTGEIVVPVQRLVPDPCRHAICVYVSADAGKSWEPSNVIDLGGHGHHDGAMEPTIVELNDGRVWMIIRTNLDVFWEAFSFDNGRSWRILRPTEIDSSSAPPNILRLSSGRLALVWNRLCAKGRKRPPRRGGDRQLCIPMASWFREELSLAFSDDDGNTWTEPAVILRIKGGGPSYPCLFEPRPDDLWITSQFRDLVSLRLKESEFAG